MQILAQEKVRIKILLHFICVNLYSRSAVCKAQSVGLCQSVEITQLHYAVGVRSLFQTRLSSDVADVTTDVTLLYLPVIWRCINSAKTAAHDM